MVHGLGQHSGGGGAVTGSVVGLGSNFLHQLGAHVLELVLKLDFLGNSHAVLGDDGSAEALLNGHVAALGSQGHLHGVGQLVNAYSQAFACFDIKNNFFSGHDCLSSNHFLIVIYCLVISLR